MKIGIDARSLIGYKSGIGQYLQQILNVWANDNRNEYYLFSPRDFELTEEIKSMKKVVSYGRVNSLWMQYAIPLLLDKYKIDLFWGPNYSIPLFYPYQTKTVITIHDMVSFVYPETLPIKTVTHNRYGLPLYINQADRIITESESTKKDIIKFLNYPSSQIEITLLGVNQRFYQKVNNINEELLKLNINFPYILCVGTIEPRKNISGVITTYLRLLEHYSFDHRLVIVGAKGWKYSTIFELIDKNPILKERVYFLGYVPEEDLPVLYQGSSLFVYPSFYEGFGLPPLEAMASGIPVIASKVSSMPEVIGQSGLLVNPHSIEELSNAMKKVLSDKEIAVSLSTSGNERARKFTWERTARQTLNVFEHVMSEGSN